jgi:hypothetical protein
MLRPPNTDGWGNKLVTIFARHLDNFILKNKLSNTQFTLLASGTQDSDKSGLITCTWICKNCAIPSSPPGQITGPADAGVSDTARMASSGNVYSLNRRAVRFKELPTRTSLRNNVSETF